MMEEENNKNPNQEEMTPIIDGDARPDIDLDGIDALKNKKDKKDKDNVTINRARDVNSLEDYKDKQ